MNQSSSLPETDQHVQDEQPTAMIHQDKIPIITSDGEQFMVDYDIVKQFTTIHTMLQDLGYEPGDGKKISTIPVPNVTADVFRKVLVWCEQHRTDEPFVEKDDQLPYSTNRPVDTSLPEWDVEYFKVDHDTLYDIIMATNYLNIKRMLEYACRDLANQIKGKTTEELRAHFGIVNDFTKEEEEKILQENAWFE